MLDSWISAPKKGKKNAVFEKIVQLLDISTNKKELRKAVLKSAGIFCAKMDTKWKKCHRTRSNLEKQQKKWLETEIFLCKSINQIRGTKQLKPSPGCSRGRPRKDFQESSQKTKIRRVADLVSNYSLEELSFAVQESSKQKNITNTVATKKSLLLQDTLALFLDLDLSQRKYNLLRSVINNLHHDCLPSLYKVISFRNKLIPQNIFCTEQGAEIDLQLLLDNTLKSILKILETKSLNIGPNSNLTLVCKYGFDGSSGHSTYKQKFSSSEMTDEYLFLVAMCPLKLMNEEGDILWKNPRTSSTFYCRPIKFLFSKENADLVKGESLKLQKQIDNLKSCDIHIKDTDFVVQYILHFTMLDGSCINTLSETNSTQKCFICGSSPKEMNTDKVFEKVTKIENLNFGLSSLHSWIRCFECLLHIAYRLPIKCWQVKGPENKTLVENQKQKIQKDFRVQMGLIVDKPKPGYGSTNDGNTARRFFQNPELSSSITGINKELILKFSKILRVVSIGEKIKLLQFQQLLKDTRNLYIELYPWYYMPCSVHKLLVHGCEIIQNFDLPIGQLAEDALEARHKDVRKVRLNHTRKNSRKSSNRDIMNNLLLTSDPFISSLRKATTSKSRHRQDNINDIKEYLETESFCLQQYSDNLPLDIGELDLQSTDSTDLSESD